MVRLLGELVIYDNHNVHGGHNEKQDLIKRKN